MRAKLTRFANARLLATLVVAALCWATAASRASATSDVLGPSLSIGTQASAAPPAPQCGPKVPAYVNGEWRCVTAGASTNDSLTLIAAEVPGLRASGHGSAAAKLALGSVIPAKRLGHVAAAVTFSSRGQRLSTATYELSSPTSAGKILASLGHSFRRLKGVGDQAKVSAGGGTSKRVPTTAVVVLRVGRAVAVLRLTVPAAIKKVRVSAVRSYARTLAGDDSTTLAARLKRVLTLTPWQTNLDQISPTGTVSKQVALRAFALMYGSLPGAPRPAGATGAPGDGTLAIEMVAGVWDQLSAAQQAAVNTDLGLPSPAGSATEPQAAAAAPAPTPDPANTAIAEHWVQRYSAVIPGVPAITVEVVKNPTLIVSAKFGPAVADADPIGADGNQAKQGSPMSSCLVRESPSLLDDGSDYVNLVLAHEVFHCVTFALDPTWAKLGYWIVEGMAEWAALTVDPVSPDVDDDSFVQYLTSPTVPLFERAYDGVGFWGHADEVLGGRGSLWSEIPAILAAGNESSANAFVAAGATSQDFVQTWASAAFRLPSGGQPWEQADPWDLPQSEAQTPIVPLTGGGGELKSDPYAMAEHGLVFNPDAPLVDIGPITGSLRIANGPGGGDLGVVDSEQWLCTGGGDCQCPDGTTGDPPKSDSVSGTSLFMALTGGDEEGRADVTTHSLSEYCKPDQDEGGGGGGGGGATPSAGGLRVSSVDLNKLGDIDHGTCSINDGAFDIDASGDGFDLHAHLAGYTSPGKLYTFSSADRNHYVTVNRYTSLSTGKLGLGGFKFIKSGGHYRVSLGFDALFAGNSEIIITPESGGLGC